MHKFLQARLWHPVECHEDRVAQRPAAETALWVVLPMVMMIQPHFSITSCDQIITPDVVKWWLRIVVCCVSFSWHLCILPPPHPRAFSDVFTFSSPLCSCVSMFLPSSEWNTQSLTCSLQVSLKTNYVPTLKYNNLELHPTQGMILLSENQIPLWHFFLLIPRCHPSYSQLNDHKKSFPQNFPFLRGSSYQSYFQPENLFFESGRILQIPVGRNISSFD